MGGDFTGNGDLGAGARCFLVRVTLGAICTVLFGDIWGLTLDWIDWGNGPWSALIKWE